MRFECSSSLPWLARQLPRLLDLVGRDRWNKRANQLNLEQRSSPYLWKIVSDYHWLEMAISHQTDVLEKDGQLRADLVDPMTLAALHFASAVVEIHSKLPEAARRRLEGRLRDGLNAESGFAALYLEVDLALRLMTDGCDVRFPDLEGAANYDIEFSRDGFVGEVECKSLSADAGRRIHRKDFYRFIYSLAPSLEAHAALERQEVLVITLRDRLSRNVSSQAELRRAAAFMLGANAPASTSRAGFRIDRRPYSECLGSAPLNDRHAIYQFCEQTFGSSPHVAGSLTETGGCFVVVRSEREEDTSEPWLEAMRKAATQFSGKRPSFIAVQFQDLAAPDLMLPHLRRRAGILSYALFGHYGASHVNATYVSGYAAVVARDGKLGAPAFAVPNPQPKYPLDPRQAAPFLEHVLDADYAAAIGAPLPAPNISNLEF
jgi:hypothetical protein